MITSSGNKTIGKGTTSPQQVKCCCHKKFKFSFLNNKVYEKSITKSSFILQKEMVVFS